MSHFYGCGRGFCPLSVRIWKHSRRYAVVMSRSLIRIEIHESCFKKLSKAVEATTAVMGCSSELKPSLPSFKSAVRWLGIKT